jgi:hypothetical protein
MSPLLIFALSCYAAALPVYVMFRKASRPAPATSSKLRQVKAVFLRRIPGADMKGLKELAYSFVGSIPDMNYDLVLLERAVRDYFAPGDPDLEGAREALRNLIVKSRTGPGAKAHPLKPRSLGERYGYPGMEFSAR